MYRYVQHEEGRGDGEGVELKCLWGHKLDDETVVIHQGSQNETGCGSQRKKF